MKNEKLTLLLSSLAIIVSGLGLVVNWQSFILTNRPYLMITPLTSGNSKKFYEIKQTAKDAYEVRFKFELKNIGKVPANAVKTDHEIIFSIRDFDANRIVDSTMKEVVKSMEPGVIDLIDIPEEKIDDEEIINFLKQYKNMDIKFTPLYNKWKTLAIFPGEDFVYINGVSVSGKDASMLIRYFSKAVEVHFRVNVVYWGVLPKVGRSYYTTYKAMLNNGSLLPYCSESR